MANLLRYWKDCFWSQRAAKRQKDLFAGVETFCMFIGHGRSGHTLWGALMNAHPEIVLGHELDALSYVERSISRDQLYALILEKDRWFTREGFHWHGYEYAVPNQWQGRFERLRVIGDRKAGVSTLRLQKNPELLAKLRQTVGVPLRVIHVLRNPFDIISTLARQSGDPLDEDAVRGHFNMTETNARLLAMFEPLEVLTMRHEDLIAAPKVRLRQLVEFVGLKADEQYLSDCAKIVFEAPSKSRLKISWPDQLIKTAQSQITKYPFLQGYSFDS